MGGPRHAALGGERCRPQGLGARSWTGEEGAAGGTGQSGLEAPCLRVAPSPPPPSRLRLLLSLSSSLPLGVFAVLLLPSRHPCPQARVPPLRSGTPRPAPLRGGALLGRSSNFPLNSRPSPMTPAPPSPPPAPSGHSCTSPSRGPRVIPLRAPLPSPILAQNSRRSGHLLAPSGRQSHRGCGSGCGQSPVGQTEGKVGVPGPAQLRPGGTQSRVFSALAPRWAGEPHWTRVRS